jgi:hypothetical protein
VTTAKIWARRMDVLRMEEEEEEPDRRHRFRCYIDQSEQSDLEIGGKM